MSKPTGFLSQTHWNNADEAYVNNNVNHFDDPFDD